MSNPSVLFVDDEPAVGKIIQRHLRDRFDVVPVNSGLEALELLETEKTFPVVVSDMEMPVMNGLEFIKKAAKRFPDSVFLMLTANTDRQTAVDAVNHGQIFKFLTKPIQKEQLAEAIELALQKQQADRSEKELLNRTFLSSVQILIDILESSCPATFERTNEIEKLAVSIAEAAGIESDWQLKIAAKLVMVGVAVHPESERIAARLRRPLNHDTLQALHDCAQTTMKLIERVPRLGNVASIIGQHMSISGDHANASLANTEINENEIKALILKTAVLWESIKSRHPSETQAMTEIKQFIPDLTEDILQVLHESIAPIDEEGIALHPLARLQPGMVLAKDVIIKDGMRLLRRGRCLDEATIDKLGYYIADQPILIAVTLT